VVGVDILFFRHHFTERLMANVGIVLVFAAFGLLIFRTPAAPRQGAAPRRRARNRKDVTGD